MSTAGGDIGAVICDFGNVLVRWDREPLYRTLNPDDERRRFFMERIESELRARPRLLTRR